MEQNVIDLATLRADIWHVWVACFPDREPPEPTDDDLPEREMLRQIRDHIRELHTRRTS